jgi:hypothetical protein
MSHISARLCHYATPAGEEFPVAKQVYVAESDLFPSQAKQENFRDTSLNKWLDARVN